MKLGSRNIGPNVLGGEAFVIEGLRNIESDCRFSEQLTVSRMAGGFDERRIERQDLTFVVEKSLSNG